MYECETYKHKELFSTELSQSSKTTLFLCNQMDQTIERKHTFLFFYSAEETTKS